MLFKKCKQITIDEEKISDQTKEIVLEFLLNKIDKILGVLSECGSRKDQNVN